MSPYIINAFHQHLLFVVRCKSFLLFFGSRMTTYRLPGFLRQTWTLTKKILLVAVVRHWPSTLFRSMILPIAYIILLLNIKNFLGYDNGYGVGSAQPVHNLLASIPHSKKFAFVQPPGLGPDVDRVVTALATPLQNTKQLVYLTDQNDLLTSCRENLYGITDCFAAIIFNDSPLTTGKKGIWNYTIRGDSKRNGFPFHAEGHSNDADLIYLPLQVALENAITNSTIIPDEYMFTSHSASEGEQLMRQEYQRVVIRSYGVAFLISLTSVIYHLVGMAASERESGMTQLIDAMGGSPAARICSYVLAFDLIYLPSWIVFGACEYSQNFSQTNLTAAYQFSVLGRTVPNLKRLDLPILANPHRHGIDECGHVLGHVFQPRTNVGVFQRHWLPTHRAWWPNCQRQ